MTTRQHWLVEVMAVGKKCISLRRRQKQHHTEARDSDWFLVTMRLNRRCSLTQTHVSASAASVPACHRCLAAPLNWIYQLYNFCPAVFLIQTIFYNSANVPCLFRVVINGRSNVANRKIPNYQLVCFVLVQIQTDFPSTDQEISLKSPMFPSDKISWK
jgi:hypothetical protein